jgi:hypothetical protein
VAIPSITITYAAHTASCTFLLDSEGICRRIVMKPRGKRRESSRTAIRCVGAQYVASLDGSAAGGLVEMPRVGAAMLFARVDERGRVSLVRTGVVTAFESQAGEDPFLEASSVETSAPDVPPGHGAHEANAARAAQPAHEVEEDEPSDPDYCDQSDRTQRIPALRPEQIAAALGHDLATSEYHAARASRTERDPRTTLPSNVGPGATLRNPHRDTRVDDEDLYGSPAPPPAPTSVRGMLPRRTDSQVGGGAARPHVPAPRSSPPAYSSDIQVARRRRG